MRPLPAAQKRSVASGPKRFVDANRGIDTASGSEQQPWKTLTHALRQLQPGDTLYLRGGVYYEKIAPPRSGTAEAPITIAAYPGELAIIDGGLREFFEDPAGSWQPFAGGAEGEYVSTRTYPNTDERRLPLQFLPNSHEPMWGIEDERPLVLGNFADSMVPLHGYRIPVDLRSQNELWIGGKKGMLDIGFYCGPGMWFSRQTDRIHIRLAHHRLAGLGDRAYRGETDPRKLSLVISAGFGNEVVRLTGLKHVKMQDLVLRGATGSAMLSVYGSENVTLDHLTVYGGDPAVQVNASKDVHVVHSAFRGLAAPWTSRAHMKYRGSASYQVVLQSHQPMNENIEFAFCEFTDDHDFAFMRYVKNLQFHHNLVENFNDDGIEIGPKLRSHTQFISQNRIGACLIPLSQHELDKDESPVDHDPACGSFVFRNVIDLRAGTYKSPPTDADPSGKYLHEEGHLASDHGGPLWPVIHFYHNTVLRNSPVFRDGFLMGLGSAGMRHNERDVFNNIFVQSDRVPGVGFIGMKEAVNVREGGNIIWGLVEGPSITHDYFAKFRTTPLFAASKQFYAPGWTTNDRVVDPQFNALTGDGQAKVDLRLRSTSPAINSGVEVPGAFPDPLRDSDGGKPDVGAVPQDVKPWGIGVDGRLSLFGN